MNNTEKIHGETIFLFIYACYHENNIDNNISKRDQHFSVINQFLKPEILKEKLTCAEDIANKINKHQELSNEYKRQINSHRKNLLLQLI